MKFKKLFQSWVESVSAADMETFGSLYTPDARLIVALSPDPIEGREAIRQFEGTIAAAFPGANLSISPPMSAGIVAAVEWTYSGVNNGPLTTPDGVLDPTGREIRLQGASIFQINSDGLIAEEHRYYNPALLFSQLGLAS